MKIKFEKITEIVFYFCVIVGLLSILSYLLQIF